MAVWFNTHTAVLCDGDKDNGSLSQPSHSSASWQRIKDLVVWASVRTAVLCQSACYAISVWVDVL